MKTGNRLKKWKILAAGFVFMTTASAATAPVAAGSLLSVTGESQIRPIEDGSGKYILKSDGFYCLKEDGSKDTAPAVHYFDHVNIDGTILDGFYYHDETGCFQAGSSHMVKITKLSCAKSTDEDAETVDFDGYYMVNNLGKLTAAPQVRYISNYVIDNTTYDGYYYFEPQLTSMLSGYDGTWSVYVKDLDTDEEIILNDTQIYSASLIKAFVMAKTYEDMDTVLKHEAALMKTDKDSAKVKDKVDTLLWNMITVSDNESCNELGRLQSEKHDFLDGAELVNKYLEKEGYTETTYQNTLHPSSSQKLSLGGHNMTTVKDCGKLLERIYKGECVSREASEEMLNLLSNQENTTKIPEGVPTDVKTANKTGETDENQHDIAIVYGPKTTYILCVMSEDSANAIANIRSISKVVYNYLNL